MRTDISAQTSTRAKDTYFKASIRATTSRTRFIRSTVENSGDHRCRRRRRRHSGGWDASRCNCNKMRFVNFLDETLGCQCGLHHDEGDNGLDGSVRVGVGVRVWLLFCYYWRLLPHFHLVVLLLLFVCSGVLSVVRLSLLLLASSHYEVQGTVHVPYGNKK